MPRAAEKRTPVPSARSRQNRIGGRSLGKSSVRATPRIVVRRSPVHGRGVFAKRRIRTGSRIIEYVGERLDPAAFQARYGGAAAHDPHTMLFSLDSGDSIDASVGGNAARFINHSCAPNCEAIQEGDRIFIFAIQNIPPGTELAYDYALQIEANPTPARLRQYGCRCGAPTCRGTVLDPALARRARGAGRRRRRPEGASRDRRIRRSPSLTRPELV